MSTEAMTSRERLMAAFQSQPVDRVPIKIWGASPWVQRLAPVFQPILDLALEKTDLAVQWGMDTGYYMTHMDAVDLWHSDKPSEHEGFRERHTVVHTQARRPARRPPVLDRAQARHADEVRHRERRGRQEVPVHPLHADRARRRRLLLPAAGDWASAAS